MKKIKAYVCRVCGHELGRCGLWFYIQHRLEHREED